MSRNDKGSAGMEGAERTEWTITEKMEELDGAVEWFYGEEFELGVALEKYKAAVGLAEEVEADLEKLKNEVEVVADFAKEG